MENPGMRLWIAVGKRVRSEIRQNYPQDVRYQRTGRAQAWCAITACLSGLAAKVDRSALRML